MKTAVEWLVEEFKEKLIGNNLPNWVLDVIQQAKEMEKNQIIEAYNTSFLLRHEPYSTAEKYYKQKYESNT